jgi:lipid-A-disaccharide synthase
VDNGQRTTDNGQRTIFFSVGEPSGDLHGANLIRALARQSPGLCFEGFGGDRMAAEGCRLLYPLCNLSVMGLFGVLSNLRLFFRLAGQAEQHFRDHRPDAVVLIDYPGFNWHIARRAHALGIPVFYFVPPQIWAWANWRVRKMRRWVDHVLCTLSFEQPWFEQHGVKAEYVGHPYFDDLRAQQLDSAFLARQRSQPGTVIGLLPGSRRRELEHLFATQLRAAALIHAQRPETRFLVACFRREHGDMAVRQLRTLFPADSPPSGNYQDGLRSGWSLPVEVCVGRTPEIIEVAHSCVAASGSVGLELLFRNKPAVIHYGGKLLELLLYRLLRTVPYISLVNLLAERKLFPEYLSHRCKAAAISAHVLRWLDDRGTYDALRGELAALRDRVAEAGACERAAAHILSSVVHRPLSVA